MRASRSREAKAREIIEAALTRVLGYPCRIESATFDELEAGIEPGAERPPQKANGRAAVKEKTSPYDTTRGKAAMNIFGISKFDEKGEEK